MAFQDFDLITERRKNERKQRLRKRIAIGAVCTIVIIGLVAAASFVVITKDGGKAKDSHKKSPSPPATQQATSKISQSEKIVKTMCNSTDYKEKCESSLVKEVKKINNKSLQPKDLLTISIKVAEEELKKAFNKTTSLKFESDKDKGAYEDCKSVIEDAKEELGLTSSHLSTLELNKLASHESDINSWLSAVISYQQICIDGVSDEKLRNEMQDIFKDAQEYVSNSLAFVSQLASFLSGLQKGASNKRNLLSEKSMSPEGSLDKNNHGLPEWRVDDEERRMLKAADDKPTPNVTVAQDGSGNYKTISEALAAIPQKYEGRYVVYVKAGIYEETVTVAKRMGNLTIYGDGSQKSVISGNKNFVDGVRTFQTATFVVLGEGFIGKAMGFRNTAGPEKHQAVAARVQADGAVFVNCRFEGYQDTLYVQTHRQFYRSCVISGTVDFIFGDAAAVFQNCIMQIRKPLENQQNIITAQGRADKRQTTGIVLQNCVIRPDESLTPEKSKFKSYLGRPWKEYSRTIVMESQIEDVIDPAGWMPWAGDFALSTLYYAEFKNTGPGSGTDNRVKWPGYKVINKEEASKFTVESFLVGDWISGTGVPAQRGLYS